MTMHVAVKSEIPPRFPPLGASPEVVSAEEAVGAVDSITFLSHQCSESILRMDRFSNVITIGYAMDKIVPLISSGTCGPLGVLHLPRLWLKGLLGATGQLAEGYKDIGPGYDHMVLEGLGIDPDKAREFIRANKPSYIQFEEWVKSYPGAKLDKANIFRVNAGIAGYIHSDDVRKDILGSCGAKSEGDVSPGAIDLNNLDDWQTVHQALVGSNG